MVLDVAGTPRRIRARKGVVLATGGYGHNATMRRQFMPAPVTQLGALIGYLAVTKSASDLSDPAQATFVYARKFSTP